MYASSDAPMSTFTFATWTAERVIMSGCGMLVTIRLADLAVRLEGHVERRCGTHEEGAGGGGVQREAVALDLEGRVAVRVEQEGSVHGVVLHQLVVVQCAHLLGRQAVSRGMCVVRVVGRSGEGCGFSAETHVVPESEAHVAEGCGATSARRRDGATCARPTEVGTREGSHDGSERGVAHRELVTVRSHCLFRPGLDREKPRVHGRPDHSFGQPWLQGFMVGRIPYRDL